MTYEKLHPGDLLTTKRPSSLIPHLILSDDDGYEWPINVVSELTNNRDPLFLVAVKPNVVEINMGHSSDTLYYLLHPHYLGWHVVEDDQWEQAFVREKTS